MGGGVWGGREGWGVGVGAVASLYRLAQWRLLIRRWKRAALPQIIALPLSQHSPSTPPPLPPSLLHPRPPLFLCPCTNCRLSQHPHPPPITPRLSPQCQENHCPGASWTYSLGLFVGWSIDTLTRRHRQTPRSLQTPLSLSLSLSRATAHTHTHTLKHRERKRLRERERERERESEREREREREREQLASFCSVKFISLIWLKVCSKTFLRTTSSNITLHWVVIRKRQKNLWSSNVKSLPKEWVPALCIRKCKKVTNENRASLTFTTVAVNVKSTFVFFCGRFLL